METLPLSRRTALGDGFQNHWYAHVAKWLRGRSVLDVGAGSGCGLPIFHAAGAASVRGIDPLPCGPGVVAGLIDAEPTAGFDYVTAFDVIEHVEDDVGFFTHMLRCARIGAFISTPNWDYFHAGNPYHVREYTPAELAALLGGRRIDLWSSDAHCVIRPATFATAQHNFGVLIHL